MLPILLKESLPLPNRPPESHSPDLPLFLFPLSLSPSLSPPPSTSPCRKHSSPAVEGVRRSASNPGCKLPSRGGVAYVTQEEVSTYSIQKKATGTTETSHQKDLDPEQSDCACTFISSSMGHTAHPLTIPLTCLAESQPLRALSTHHSGMVTRKA